MLHRRISYAVAFAAAVCFQIFFRAPLSTFVLALVAVFPFLSLAVSLPGMLGCTLTLSPEAGAVPRGGACAFRLALDNRLRQPLSQAALRLTCLNQLTGESWSVRRFLRGASQGAVLTEAFSSLHCGRLEARLERARVCDLLGLFALPLPLPDPAGLLVLPVPEGLDVPTEPEDGRGEGAGLRPRPGGGPGEDYDLRAYRAGDPMRSVHWKLSSKLDELVVRETLEPNRAVLVLTFDHFGAPEALDSTLDQLYAHSLRLLDGARPHHIQWAAPDSGAVTDCAVTDRAGLLRCLALACSTPAPPAGRSILDGPVRVPGADGPVRHLHVWPEEGGQ